MILSPSFVSLMTSTNFFLLRLDCFIQLLETFSVVISLEFVFPNLCLTVSENLFSLSLQESPNLFTLKSCVSEFLGRSTQVSKQWVSPFYHDWLTTTDRTTGLLLQCDRLVFGTRQRASCRWWRHRSRSHQGTVARPRIPGCIRHKPLWWSGR